LVKVLYRWFTAVPSKGKAVTGPMVIERVESFYDEMKITGTVSEGSNNKAGNVLGM
jgi:hypothetical protein